jgi:succinate dehydrogenase / fumarate reductase cytochrome b subunit
MSTASAGPRRLFDTVLGLKLLMAITGLVWVGFLVGHLAGNALVFLGRDAINAYAYKLKSSGPLLWGARGVLLLAFVTHVWAAMQLTSRNRAARPRGYGKGLRSQRTGAAAKLMLLSGMVVLTFLVFHLAHFTLGLTNPDHFALRDASGHHDVYGMVVLGFQTPWLAAIYLVGVALLAAHLSHAIGSLLRTLGFDLDSQRNLALVGPALAAIIVIGKLAIVLGVAAGFVPDPAYPTGAAPAAAEGAAQASPKPAAHGA